MANELALILKSPVEELIPKMIAWNNAELLARVEATLEQYNGVTYDDSQIATAKADRAQLNAFCKALNDERIRIGKVYNAPYEKFKGEVDEVLQKVKGTVHLAFGNSRGMGGNNDVPVHIDCVIRKPSVYIDGRLVIEEGEWRI